MPNFDSVLIANRGEIAVRIIGACRLERLRAVAVYSDADAAALHVRRADEAHRIGPSPPAESYLNGEAIIEAARTSGAQAIHPGYGFLAENADFAERCQQAGLVWIGPPPSAMRLLGDKAAAKALADRIGVPTLPGYHGDAQDEESLRSAAERVGYPLLVKAAAGGGGRGMRLVRAPHELDDALVAARREAESAFGDGRLLLERYLERPRHIEMQILADEHGRCLYLGERDCSVQRRHQKVIEEAPAQHFSKAQRKQMGEASVALAEAANYTNAGTVEYLLDTNGEFYFLEMNTRLQVEHRVTELVTGLDLVRQQLAAAAGRPLAMTQDQVEIGGHAIECRIYAEDSEHGFLPSTGTLEVLKFEHSRRTWGRTLIDYGYHQGDLISPYYDPLIAKLVVCSDDRPMVIQRLVDLLSECRIEGVKTNLPFLQIVLATAAFRNGRVDTGFVERELAGVDWVGAFADFILAAVASEVLSSGWPRFAPEAIDDAPTRVWIGSGPWRLGWLGAQVSYSTVAGVVSVGVAPPFEPDEPWQFTLRGIPLSRKLRRSRTPLRQDDELHPLIIDLDSGDGWSQFSIERDGLARRISNFPQYVTLRLASALERRLDPTQGGATTVRDVISAPMPGRIVKLLTKPGEQVKANQTLLVLEAMKIEHLVTAPRDGVVEAVRYREGDQVELGAELIELED